MQLTAIALWLNTAFAVFDESIAIAVHRLFEVAGGFFTPFLSIVSELGHGGIPLLIASLVMMLFRKTRPFGTAMFFAVVIGALITNLTLKPLVARPRPYIWLGSIYHRYWIEAGHHIESDKSFPSGHMTAATAASVAVFLKGNRRVSWTALIFAFLMGLSRIYLSVHYTTDVLGGVIAGGIGGFLGYFLSGKLPGQWYAFTLRDILRWIFRRGPFPFRREGRAERGGAPPAREDAPDREQPAGHRGKHEKK